MVYRLISGLLCVGMVMAVFAQEPGAERITHSSAGKRMAHNETPVTQDDKPPVTMAGAQNVCPRLYNTEFLDQKKKIQSLWQEANQLIKSGVFAKAIELQQQALEIAQLIKSQRAEAMALHLIGWSYESQHQYPEAIDAYRKAAVLRRKCRQYEALAETLINLCGVYFDTAQYARALEACQEAIPVIRQPNGNNSGKTSLLAKVLSNQGLNYIELGQFRRAIKLLEQALPILKMSNEQTNLARLYHNIGYAYSEIRNYKNALKYYQQALTQRQQLGDQAGIASTLNNMGFLRAQQGQRQVALTLLKEALSAARLAGDRLIEGRTLDSLGDTYTLVNDYNKAQRAYNDALVIRKQLHDRKGERVTLGNIGKLLEAQGRDKLAIVFYQQAVNVSEAIRGELYNLPGEIVSTYTDKVSRIYRRLAALLLKHERIIEAQRVIDLLKVQELEDYLQTIRGNDKSLQGLPEAPQDQQVSKAFFKKLVAIVQLVQEMEALQASEHELTPEEQTQLELLDKKETELSGQFVQFYQSDEIREWERNRAEVDEDAQLKVKQLSALQKNLREIGHTAIVYPLILENRLELVLTIAEGSPVHVSVDITRSNLNRLISDYLNALRNPGLDVRPAAQKLYALLIAPLDKVLTDLDVKSIIYMPDRTLRYVPLSALYDGRQWLIERFRVYRITSTTLSDLNKKPAKKLKLLAAAFSSGETDFAIGDEEFRFRGLRFAGIEVEALKRAIPGTKLILDKQFTIAKVRAEARFYTVIHLATHAAFVVGQPDESFILFGNGERLTLKQVQQKWTNKLRNINLIVLSACETGIGGRLGSGEEILGFGYLMEEAGADASITTLWQVDDGGTQILMNEFYQQLVKPDSGKAEALRQAQLEFIRSDEEGSTIDRGAILADNKPTLKGRLSHPYYWAPFILVGNGL